MVGSHLRHGMTSRRRYLAGLGLAATLGMAGCTTDLGSGSGGSAPDGTRTSSGNSSAAQGLSLPVPESELQRGAAQDAIPAITDPVFESDWSGYSSEQYGSASLSDDDTVIGVARAGEARAYPLRILNWHEVVNDEFGGPLLVTYCPLCGSGMTAVRKAAGEETVFGVSGLLYRNDLVMYDDATNSLWGQIVATAIRGELTGETLQLVPSALTTWGEWQETYPDTVVLRPPPESDTVKDSGDVRDYSRNPYAGYDESRDIGVGFSGGDYDDDRLHPKTTVIGVGHDGEAVAYPLSAVQNAGVVNDTVDDLPVVVAATADGTLVAYVRRVDGEAVTFERADETHLQAAGSR
ncbi:MAG: hypothetical protein ACI9CA_002130, partial [Natronomonas sp.]